MVARLAGPAVNDADRSPPVPVEMPTSGGPDGKVPDKVVPVPADDPNVATLADSVHANA